MHVLNLVTNANSTIFEQQLDTLTAHGVTCDTVQVPGERYSPDESSPGRSFWDYIRFYPQVLRQARKGYDLVHANYGLTAPAALAQPSRPVVVSLWGSDLLGDFGFVSRWCARRADAVIVRSPQMADSLGAVDAYVIPHGVDLALFQPDDHSAARARVNWREDAAHVLFPYAKDRPVKDFPRAASIVEAVRDRLRDDIVLHSIQDVSHADMPDYMNAADALLLTSSREGSPNSVKEAMACNLPVVSTDVGDVAERLGPVSPSFVCQTDEELIAGLESVLHQRVRSNGREHVRDLGLERMGERIVSVYESVM